ncbi:MAG: endolytic transglycosylase MltG, partial [Thiotrichaceae bacterium]|nr:endolytic transglycosylase MltG [Thiotrichaceae bacterium]
MIKVIFKFFALLIIAASIVFAWYWSEYKISLKMPIQLTDNASAYIFTINKGDSIKQIGQSLENMHIIKQAKYFYLYSRISKQAGKIKAGEYALKTGMTIVDLVELFVSGKVTQYSTTIVEGWTFKEALLHIAQDKHLKLSQNLNMVELKKQFGSEHENLEGLIYPDTYHFPLATTDVQFLQRSYNQMQLILAEEWAGKEEGLPLKTPYEALILASIVEKESGGNSERSKIAG